MSTYLLLRDNKQTGPYSLEEIRAKGFKPYDLIWVEGKSAGWRYPGELPELASLAPIVEEQPFDRFYKKKPVESVSVAAEVKNPPKEVVPQVPQQNAPAIIRPISNAKIFVSRPVSSTDTPHPATVEPQTNTPQKKQREPIQPHFEKEGAFPKTPETKSDESLLAPSKQPAKPYLSTSGTSLPGNSLLLKAAVLVIILLSGVIIGLMLNNSQQSQLQKDLQARVEAIKNKKDLPAAITKTQDRSTESQVLPSIIQAEPPTVLPAPSIAVKNNARQDRPVATAAVQLKAVESGKITAPETESDKTTVIPIPVPIPKASAPLISRDKILPLIQVEANKYKVGVLGGISGLEITVTNNSLYEIDMMQVIVHYLGPENKVVRDQTIIIASVPAGQQKTIPVERSSRGVKVSYSIGKIEASGSSEFVTGTN